MWPSYGSTKKLSKILNKRNGIYRFGSASYYYRLAAYRISFSVTAADNTIRLPLWRNNCYHVDSCFTCWFYHSDTNPAGPAALPFFILLLDSPIKFLSIKRCTLLTVSTSEKRLLSRNLSWYLFRAIFWSPSITSNLRFLFLIHCLPIITWLVLIILSAVLRTSHFWSFLLQTSISQTSLFLSASHLTW